PSGPESSRARPPARPRDPRQEFPAASVCPSLALPRAGGRILRLLPLRLVDVADPRRAREEGEAFRVSGFAGSLDMRDHVIGDRLDIFRPQKRAGFGRHLCPRFLAVHAVAFHLVVGTACKERHPGARPPAADGFNDLLPRQLGLAQRQRITSVAATAIAVPFVAPDAIGLAEHRLAGIGRIRSWRLRRLTVSSGWHRKTEGGDTHEQDACRRRKWVAFHFTSLVEEAGGPDRLAGPRF